MTRDAPPMVVFVGRSGVGKTTFLTQLVTELKARHYRVAVVKHHSHAGIEIDQPGKDTWRHYQAGADMVVFLAPDRMALYRRLVHEPTPDELVESLPDKVDFVLAEGFKDLAGRLPAIEVARAAVSRELVTDPTHLIALVTDLRLPLPLPRFGLDDAAGLADWLERRFRPPQAEEAAQPPAAR